MRYSLRHTLAPVGPRAGRAVDPDASGHFVVVPRPRGLRRAALALLAMLPALCAQAPAPAGAGALPFAAGERLEYRARVARFGEIGRAAMWVEGPAELRGVRALRLRFDIDTKVGIVRVVDRTESWLDPERMTALRYHKHERHPLAKRDERVELYPGARRWERADGVHGASDTDLPLDELSFLYYVRTLPLDADTAVTVARHFDPERNPTTVRVVGRETLATPAGEFRTVVVEMRVRDLRRYGRAGGEGVLRLHLSDDARRLPVRIESTVPIAGRAVLTLDAYVPPAGGAPLLAGAP
ncbi:DUF3108 domain-containing protein [Roseisolibacter sp. H3M3-2]|uniref:DUF3108 domain-containing protein n=1 Tax=Roseisolibacter sp. H3M3-2 TaxID=3031323 RepID=UPI0023DC2B60|nr:DUF3108 domain-containing protein [Roseisolibacter sp. H3M3-2]MDF1504006.1 DUF3108 domain-containing protein [Roseisolibacter sp. H3M3-2]